MQLSKFIGSIILVTKTASYRIIFSARVDIYSWMFGKGKVWQLVKSSI